MGMTIDESILYMELYKRELFNSVSDLDKDIEAYNIIIDTMRKYQKIVEIVKQKDYDGFNSYNYHGCFLRMQDIKEVIEDDKI